MVKRYSRPGLAVLVWALLCLGIPAIAETLNGLKPGGTPLGLAMMAQGAAVLLAIAALALGRRTKSRPADAEDPPHDHAV